MDKMSSSAEHLSVDFKNKLKLREINYEEVNHIGRARRSLEWSKEETWQRWS